jgi:DNA-binding FadR family transcriptional regulator
MVWLSAVAKLPGKALNVALALFWLAGMNPQQKIKMTRHALDLFKVSDDSYRDALSRLADAGLIKVWPAPGQRALVEIVRGATPES